MAGDSRKKSLNPRPSSRHLSREAKVNLALEMSSTAMALTLDSIRDQHPGISRSRLFELARRRLRTRHSIQQDVDDIRAILAHTRVTMRTILDQARKMTQSRSSEKSFNPRKTGRAVNRFSFLAIFLSSTPN